MARKPKDKLNTAQKERLSEILGNVAVTWFAAGIISPFFLKAKLGPELVINSVWGLTLSLGFTGVSLYLVKKV